MRAWRGVFCWVLQQVFVLLQLIQLLRLLAAMYSFCLRLLQLFSVQLRFFLRARQVWCFFGGCRLLCVGPDAGVCACYCSLWLPAACLRLFCITLHQFRFFGGGVLFGVFGVWVVVLVFLFWVSRCSGYIRHRLLYCSFAFLACSRSRFVRLAPFVVNNICRFKKKVQLVLKTMRTL